MPSEILPAERRKRIQDAVLSGGIVKVTELSEKMGVSELTIRRDLDNLERQGVLQRTHGGAVSNRRLRVEPLYTQKGQLNVKEKEAIGRAAAEYVQENDTLLINSGSTTARILPHLPSNIRVITSNVGGVAEHPLEGVSVVLLGGVYREQSRSVVGSMTGGILREVYGSKTFIGVDGVSATHGLTTPIYEEAEVGRMMIERSHGPVIVVADHTKLGVVSNFVTCSISQIHMLITDSGFPERFRAELEQAGVTVVLAPDVESFEGGSDR